MCEVERFLTDICSSVIKDLKALREILEPKSTVHDRRDLKVLQNHVGRVVDLVSQVPGSEELASDLAIVKKGILQETKKAKVEKPTLNVDVDELFSMLRIS